MTTPNTPPSARPVFDDQRLVRDELLAALGAFAASPDDAEAALDLLAFSAQGRRLAAHLGEPLPEPLGDLSGALSEAAATLSASAARVSAALDALVPTECLDALAGAFSWDHDPDAPPLLTPVLGALYEADRVISAWEAGGRDSAALLDEAALLAQTAPEVAAACAPAAARFVSRHGPLGGAAPIFAAVVAAAEALRLAEETEATAPETLAESDFQAALPAAPAGRGAKILQFPSHLAARRGAVADRMAAATEHRPVPEAFLAFAAPDAAWQVMFEAAPGALGAVVLYGAAPLPALAVVAADGTLCGPAVVQVESASARAAVVLAGPAPFRVTVGTGESAVTVSVEAP